MSLHDILEDAVVPCTLLDQMFICPICQTIMKNPVAIKACMHRFCFDCAMHAVRSSRVGRKRCPACRVRLASTRDFEPDPRMKALIELMHPSLDDYRTDFFLQTGSQPISAGVTTPKTPRALVAPSSSKIKQQQRLERLEKVSQFLPPELLQKLRANITGGNTPAREAAVPLDEEEEEDVQEERPQTSTRGTPKTPRNKQGRKEKDETEPRTTKHTAAKMKKKKNQIAEVIEPEEAVPAIETPHRLALAPTTTPSSTQKKKRKNISDVTSWYYNDQQGLTYEQQMSIALKRSKVEANKEDPDEVERRRMEEEKIRAEEALTEQSGLPLELLINRERRRKAKQIKSSSTQETASTSTSHTPPPTASSETQLRHTLSATAAEEQLTQAVDRVATPPPTVKLDESHSVRTNRSKEDSLSLKPRPPPSLQGTKKSTAAALTPSPRPRILLRKEGVDHSLPLVYSSAHKPSTPPPRSHTTSTLYSSRSLPAFPLSTHPVAPSSPPLSPTTSSIRSSLLSLHPSTVFTHTFYSTDPAVLSSLRSISSVYSSPSPTSDPPVSSLSTPPRTTIPDYFASRSPSVSSFTPSSVFQSVCSHAETFNSLLLGQSDISSQPPTPPSTPLSPSLTYSFPSMINSSLPATSPPNTGHFNTLKRQSSTNNPSLKLFTRSSPPSFPLSRASSSTQSSAPSFSSGIESLLSPFFPTGSITVSLQPESVDSVSSIPQLTLTSSPDIVLTTLNPLIFIHTQSFRSSFGLEQIFPDPRSSSYAYYIRKKTRSGFTDQILTPQSTLAAAQFHHNRIVGKDKNEPVTIIVKPS